MRPSFITPVINTWISPRPLGPRGKSRFLPTVTTKSEQALPYPISHLKGIQCKLRSGAFSAPGWLMPYVRLMLKIHKGWYTWFITPAMFCQSNSWSLGTVSTAQLCSLLQLTASSTIAALLSFHLSTMLAFRNDFYSPNRQFSILMTSQRRMFGYKGIKKR